MPAPSPVWPASTRVLKNLQKSREYYMKQTEIDPDEPSSLLRGRLPRIGSWSPTRHIPSPRKSRLKLVEEGLAVRSTRLSQ